MGEIGTITGTVQSPEGAAVPINTTVALLKLDSTEPEQEMFFKETTANPANGSFTFPDMPFDYYIVVVFPPIESPLAPSPPMCFPL
ncbi:MAG: carboxypeptidase regulatory-like domain-containing protein, partial [Chloroflexi bacterium]